MKQLIASIFFLIFITFIIVCANLGYGPTLWGFVNNIPHGDKYAHFFLYGLMSIAIERILNFRIIGIGLIIVSLFALLEELSQMYINTRTFSLIDLFWSIAGITIFEATFLIYITNSHKKIR